MTIYMLRIPEMSRKEHTTPDVLSQYISDDLDRAMLWAAKLVLSMHKSVEIVSFHATQKGTLMKEYGEMHIDRKFGLTWTKFGNGPWTIYSVDSPSSYPLKMTRIGRL